MDINMSMIGVHQPFWSSATVSSSTPYFNLSWPSFSVTDVYRERCLPIPPPRGRHRSVATEDEYLLSPAVFINVFGVTMTIYKPARSTFFVYVNEVIFFISILPPTSPPLLSVSYTCQLFEQWQTVVHTFCIIIINYNN